MKMYHSQAFEWENHPQIDDFPTGRCFLEANFHWVTRSCRGSPSNSVPHEEIWALFRAPPGPDAAKGIVFVADFWTKSSIKTCNYLKEWNIYMYICTYKIMYLSIHIHIHMYIFEICRDIELSMSAMQFWVLKCPQFLQWTLFLTPR